MARRGHYRGRLFRSLMEYSFYKHLEDSGVSLEDVRYEVLRIPYRVGKRLRTYIPDFVVGTRVFEVKPESRQRGRIFEAKVKAATEYCAANGLSFSVVDHRDFRLLPARVVMKDPGVELVRRRRRKR